MAESSPHAESWAPWRRKLHEVIFEADTPSGKVFDVALLVTIVISVLAVILESVAEIRRDYAAPLRVTEWTVTIVLTI